MRKRFFIVLLCLLCVFIFSSCAQNKRVEPTAQITKYEDRHETPAKGGTLNLCLFETDTLNPLITKNSENIRTLKLIYDSLFSVYQDFSYASNLCESYTMSEDGLEYAFNIKEGITFHDGSPLTANDANFSLSLIFESGSPYASILSDIESFTANRQTLFIKLKRPVANFPALLDFPIVSERMASSVSAAIENKMEYVPNGTGLYKVQSHLKNKEMLLGVNESHHMSKKPYIDNIFLYILNDRSAAISMLENSKTDMLSSVVANPDEYTPKREFSSVEFPTNTLTFIGFNNTRPALSSFRTRKAVSSAIDRSYLTGNLLNGRAIGTDIPIHPHSWLYHRDNTALEYSVENARALLKEDGWYDSDNDGTLERTNGENTEYLYVGILVNSENTQRVKLANELRKYLDAAGIRTYLEQVPYSEYISRLNARQYDMAICEVDISANSDLKFLFETDYNIFNVSNGVLDNLMHRADKCENVASVQEIYRDICTTLRQDMPICGLYFKNGSIIFDNVLRGNIIPDNSNLFANIQEWFIAD